MKITYLQCSSTYEMTDARGNDKGSVLKKVVVKCELKVFQTFSLNEESTSDVPESATSNSIFQAGYTHL